MKQSVCDGSVAIEAPEGPDNRSIKELVPRPPKKPNEGYPAALKN
jgi:hypothetical protein